ncbi:hypothetical protein LP415_10845 [Polaromonas sp. P1(28)-8]|nr:hypothetical protein LP415_10845 [Polaromonas sp. P1(28)-8]
MVVVFSKVIPGSRKAGGFIGRGKLHLLDGSLAVPARVKNEAGTKRNGGNEAMKEGRHTLLLGAANSCKSQRLVARQQQLSPNCFQYLQRRRE